MGKIIGLLLDDNGQYNNYSQLIHEKELNFWQIKNVTLVLIEIIYIKNI